MCAVAGTDLPPRTVMDLLLFVTLKMASDSDVIATIVAFYDGDLLLLIWSDLVRIIFISSRIDLFRKLAAKVPEFCEAFHNSAGRRC
jgi:hypothetical protein